MIIGNSKDHDLYIRFSQRLRMENEKWDKEVNRLVQHYQRMEQHVPNSSMLYEVQWQYHHMAHGGNGGDIGIVAEETGETSCRAVNYPDYPDWVFQRVVEEMGWRRED